jgi:hypothetical protein
LLRELEQTRRPSHRRWIIAHVRRARSRAEWHARRAQQWAGEAEAIAAEAAWWLRDVSNQRNRALREEWLRRFRAALRRAGDCYSAETHAPAEAGAVANSKSVVSIARDLRAPKTTTPP